MTTEHLERENEELRRRLRCVEQDSLQARDTQRKAIQSNVRRLYDVCMIAVRCLCDTV